MFDSCQSVASFAATLAALNGNQFALVHIELLFLENFPFVVVVLA